MIDAIDQVALKELAQRLVAIVDGGIETESEIARKTGVDQPTISNAKHGKLKRVTLRIAPLIEYTIIREGKAVDGSEVTELARRFYEVGGTEAELTASIEHAMALVTRTLKRPAK
jgi:hypothetical protein